MIMLYSPTLPIEYKRLKAWRLHYLAKGCSERKASECTRRKSNGVTWPPTSKV